MLITRGSTVKVTCHDNSIWEGVFSRIYFVTGEKTETEILISEDDDDFENNLFGSIILGLSEIKSIEIVKPCENYKLPKKKRKWQPKDALLREDE
jgi:hypothetical protein